MAGVTLGSERETPRSVSYCTVALGASAWLAMVWSRAALAWDGSLYYVTSVDGGGLPVFRGRYTATLLLVPSWLAGPGWLSEVLFCVAYSTVPFACLWLCWRLQPDLFGWAVIGIALVTLPGQFFLVSEAVIAAQLAWPLAFVLAGPISRRRAVLGFVLGLLVLFAHPLAAVLFGVLAALGLREGHRRAALLLALGVAVAMLRPRDAHEQESLSVAVAADHWHDAVTGWPLLLLAGVMLAVAAGRAGVVVLGAAMLAGAAWAADPVAWGGAYNYRTWVVGFTVLTLGAFALLRRPIDQRVATLSLVGAALLIVVQSMSWSQIHDIDRPCGTATAVDHWSAPALEEIETGRIAERSKHEAMVGMPCQGEAHTMIDAGPATPPA